MRSVHRLVEEGPVSDTIVESAAAHTADVVIRERATLREYYAFFWPKVLGEFRFDDGR